MRTKYTLIKNMHTQKKAINMSNVKQNNLYIERRVVVQSFVKQDRATMSYVTDSKDLVS